MRRAHPNTVSVPSDHCPPYQAKLSLVGPPLYGHHRSGWPFAMDSLKPLLTAEREAVLLDYMIERSFPDGQPVRGHDWQPPYSQPWIGFVHVPPDYEQPGEEHMNPARILRGHAFQSSLPFCRGLIALSRHLADWIRARLCAVPVLRLYHPTEFVEQRFDFDEYLRGDRLVIQVGWWMRRLTSIHYLPLPRERKVLLIPYEQERSGRFLRALEFERQRSCAPPLEEWAVRFAPRLSNAGYDFLLSRSIVFLDYYACSASNAIIECMVRHTPVLVNPLPAVKEYLGEDYPLYFETLEEAAAKASDPAQVLAAHRYLAAKDLTFLSGDTFCRTLAESELYRALPLPGQLSG